MFNSESINNNNDDNNKNNNNNETATMTITPKKTTKIIATTTTRIVTITKTATTEAEASILYHSICIFVCAIDEVWDIVRLFAWGKNFRRTEKFIIAHHSSEYF